MSVERANGFQELPAGIIPSPVAEQSALQVERLAAIGQMVTAMTHESRNFLQRIKSAAELLAEIDKDDSEALDEIVRIQKAEEGLEHLLEDLRLFAAPMHLEKMHIELRTIWRTAWSDVTRLRTGEARFDESVGDIALECDVDAFRLGQVFRNLFENSLAACDGGSPCIHVCCENGDGMLKVAVRDNGTGLSAAQRDNVFQPFFTTKAKGTGLGMAIVKRIVEAHGGSIRVGDCETGAEFHLTIPSVN